jgi:hypothetical protein
MIDPKNKEPQITQIEELSSADSADLADFQKKKSIYFALKICPIC